MNQNAKALVSWIPESKGGRRTPPTGTGPSPGYSTICRFADDASWPQTAWTLVLRLERAYGEGRYWLADVQFLVPEAPHHLLKDGARFELYEGRKMVATGLVQSIAAPIPTEATPFEAVLLS